MVSRKVLPIKWLVCVNKKRLSTSWSRHHWLGEKLSSLLFSPSRCKKGKPFRSVHYVYINQARPVLKSICCRCWCHQSTTKAVSLMYTRLYVTSSTTEAVKVFTGPFRVYTSSNKDRMRSLSDNYYKTCDGPKSAFVQWQEGLCVCGGGGQYKRATIVQRGIEQCCPSSYRVRRFKELIQGPVTDL